MKNNRFYISLLIIAAVSSIVILILQFSGANHLVNPYVWFLQGYLIIVTGLTYLISSKGIKDNLMDFQNFVMASIGIRFFLSAIIIVLYIYFVKSDSISFLTNFFILYLLYTSFEIKSVLTNLRAHLKKDESK